uniref:ATP-dependent DNA helicase pif1-like n=1 Tax=Styela clava TaxID=7725 RepID=UPI00193AADA4|nr:ATP-dependent DNA helicase pif1-like [Styela clava]
MQTEVFYAIRQWCVKKANGKNPDPFHLFISGGAGTGKSHLVKAIYYETSKVLANRAEDISQIRVLLTASTGVAAYNIKATTIHSTFSIPVQATIPYRPLAEEKLNTLKCRYENLELLIIDEISMVDYKLLSYIHGRLRQIKSASDEFPFGKVSIIAVGDFYQLPPVKASPLFKPNPLGNLWNGYFKLVELNEIMGQKGDKKFAEMLNRIRTKKKGEILNACDISMLSQRETGETESDIIHIYPTNAQVNEFNLKRLLSLDKEIVEIAADVLTPTSENRSSSCRTHIPMGQLQKTLKFSVRARVMLLRNIDATDGLVNGVIGTIGSIHRAEGTIEVDVIHVRFDDNRVGATLRMRSKCRYEDGVPITKVEDSFSGRGSYKQFPLKLSWGCTIHKMQGVTVDAALVDFKKAFRAGQISECYDKNDDFFGQFKTKKQGGVGFLLRSELKVRVMDIEVLNLEFLCLLLVEKDTVLISQLQKQVEKLKENLHTFLNPDQLESLKKPRGSRANQWTDETILSALQIRYSIFDIGLDEDKITEDRITEYHIPG